MAKVAVKTFKVLLSAYRDNIMEFFLIFFFKEFGISVHKTSTLLSKSCSIISLFQTLIRSLKREEIDSICRIVFQCHFFFVFFLGGDGKRNLKNNPQSVLNCRQIHGIRILTHSRLFPPFQHPLLCHVTISVLSSRLIFLSFSFCIPQLFFL